MTDDGRFRWTGWDLRGGKNGDQSAVLEFVGTAPEDPGAGGHYELIAVAARGFRPPQLLGVLRTSGDSDSTHDAQEPEHPGLRQVWSLLYRQVAETAPSGVAPYAIYLLGVDPPPDATEDELAIFNDFYTDVHLPEVANRRGALRAVRYELLEVERPPYPAAPRFLAAYELDEKAAANRRHTGPPYSSGPDVWQRHKTPWRLWYRRLDPHGEPGN